jgi:hypothetical protein
MAGVTEWLASVLDLRRKAQAIGDETPQPAAAVPMDEDKCRRTLLFIIGMLVEGRYEELVQFTGEIRLTVAQIRDVVEDYPCRLIMPPSDSLDDLISYIDECMGEPCRCWDVDAKLWDECDGVSDLALYLELTDSSGEYYGVRLEDLRVS